MRRNSTLTFNLMALVLIAFINLNIIGIILIGYMASLENSGGSGSVTTMLFITLPATAYLALRIWTHPERLAHGSGFIIYSIGMIISVIFPHGAYLMFDLALANLQVAPLFFAQSVFMLIVLRIKMQTSKHSF
jgi:hypothetical protein